MTRAKRPAALEIFIHRGAVREPQADRRRPRRALAGKVETVIAGAARSSGLPHHYGPLPKSCQFDGSVLILWTIVSNQDRYRVLTLDKDLSVLEVLERGSTPPGMQEIALATSIQRAAVFRLLYTLERSGYVVRAGFCRAGFRPKNKDRRPKWIPRAI